VGHLSLISASAQVEAIGNNVLNLRTTELKANNFFIRLQSIYNACSKLLHLLYRFRGMCVQQHQMMGLNVLGEFRKQ